MTVSDFDRLFAACGVPGLLAHHGTPLTFRPKDGPSRTVYALELSEAESDRETPIGEEDRQTLWVSVLKNESDATYGGIASVVMGDAILRDFDTADNAWSFQGRIRNETANTWDLLFGRNGPKSYGIPRR